MAEPLLKGSANLLAATRIGGVDLELSEVEERSVAALEREFIADQKKSKPISFYTWSNDLVRVFQQDRLLQAKMKAAEHRQVVSSIKATQLTGDYLSYLAFVSRLTNPLVDVGLSMFLSSPESGELSETEEFSMLPPSASPEGELVKKLFQDQPIPEGFDLMKETIGRIRSGQIDLKPTDQSGWYDYQLWSFEPLLIPERMPESSKMTVMADYKVKLEEMFKGLYSLARETHAKQLEMPMPAGCMPPEQRRRKIVIRPQCSVEPLPTHYLRRAHVYSFLKTVLTEHLGEACLKREARMTERGRVDTSIFDELSNLIQLFYGAHCQACFELGIPAQQIEPELDQSRCRETLREWHEKAAEQDEDLNQDMRMMVPVFFDLQRKLIKVWLFMGWTKERLKVSYGNRPELLAVNGEEPDHSQYDIEFGSASRQAAYPAFTEVYVDRLLDREEFRAHCKQHRTAENIIANLPGARAAAAQK